jgi:TonB-linked SusC/RagA family outer membrane protein
MKINLLNLQKQRTGFFALRTFALFLFVCLIMPHAWASQQTKKTITGIVSDAESGEKLPGATIMEKGTSNGTITDIDGKFSLTVKDDCTIEISYVSYKSQVLPTAGKQNFNILLQPDVVGMDDVIVIGYGTIKKSDVTGAVASIASDDIRSNVGSGIDQAMQGRAAGVSVTANTGTPGASPTVRIRGMGTITNPNPFYVIDGIPVSSESVGLLNPGDIESMEILKDASAAAIYGARAANGVVLITTRRAKAGKSNISLDAYSGIQTVAKKYDLMNAKDWITYRNAAGQKWQDSSLVTNTDFQDEIFRDAIVQNLQLSFLNGNDKINSAIIGSYFKQDGIIKGSDYERFSARVNTSSKINSWLTVGETFGFTHAKQNNIPEQDEWSSVTIQALVIDPTTPVYDAVTGNPAGALLNNINNPVGLIERNHNVLTTEQILGNAYVEIKPVSWLTFKSSISTEINNSNNERFTPIFFESSTNQSTQTTLFNGNFKLNTLLMEQLLTFQKTFAEKHDVQFLLGYTRQKSSYRLNLRQVNGVPESEDLWLISNGDKATLQYEDVASTLPTGKFSGTPYDASMISYLARLIYSFNNKYDLTASVRRDGSSKFGSANRWGNFPSFAMGWKFSEESFFPKNQIINFGKLRAGWGMLGNQEIGDYAAYTNVSYGLNTTFGAYGNQVRYSGGAPTGYANAGVKWESTKQTNIGLDLTMLNSKLNINFDYFLRFTNDMLAAVPVPKLTGIQFDPTVNVGSISNKGWEFNATYRDRSGDFKYEVGFNLGSIKNNVESLGGGKPISSAQFRAGDFIARTEEDMPIAYFYGLKTDGIYQNQAEIDDLDKKARDLNGGDAKIFFDNKRAKPGDIKMKDINDDGRITAADRTFIGSPHPDLTYALNLKFEYKNFDLSIFGQGVYGNEIFMATLNYLQSGNGYWNLLNSAKNYWKQEGDITDVPRVGLQDYNMRFSDRYIKDGSFFRIKNVMLGYSLPSKIGEKAGIEKVHVYVSGQNLFCFSKYEGFDPEIGTGRGMLDIGIDRGMYPIARTVSVGLNLTF